MNKEFALYWARRTTIVPGWWSTWRCRTSERRACSSTACRWVESYWAWCRRGSRLKRSDTELSSEARYHQMNLQPRVMAWYSSRHAFLVSFYIHQHSTYTTCIYDTVYDSGWGQVPLSEKSKTKKSKTQVWSKTQLKTELDLTTKTRSKNILRPNFGLRLLS